MGRKLRALAYWTALLVSSGLLSAVSISVVVAYLDFSAHVDLWSQEKIRATIFSNGGMIVGALVVFSGVFFGWRKDRMDAQALELKRKDLEIKLRDVESRLVRAITSKERQSGKDAIGQTRLAPRDASAPLAVGGSSSTDGTRVEFPRGGSERHQLRDAVNARIDSHGLPPAETDLNRSAVAHRR